MNTAYLISGLGADRRLFKHIALPQQYHVVLVDWHIPNKKDTLQTYAQSIIGEYHIQPGSVVIGVSLGGIISVEIAKQVDLDKVILISSIKTRSEAPLYFKFFRNVPMYKVIPGKLMTKFGFMVKPLFGKMTPGGTDLFKSMLQNSSPVFVKWAMGAVLYFNNDTQLDNIYHIIGNKDLVFPYKNIQNPTAVINGGKHNMVFERATEINGLLADILK